MLNHVGRTGLLVAVLLSLCLSHAFAQDSQGSIVVWKLEAKGGVDANDVDSISGLLATEVERASGRAVITEGDVGSVLKGEQVRQQCGVDDTSCMAEIGSALGATEAVSGDLGKVGSIWILNLRFIDVRQIKVKKRVSRRVEGSIDALIRDLPSAVDELFSDEPVEDGTQAGPAAPADRDDTRFGLHNYPESFTGVRLFAYHSVFMQFAYRKGRVPVLATEDTHSMVLRPGFSFAVADRKASIYAAPTMAFLAGDTFGAQDVRLYDVTLGFNVPVYNRKPVAVTTGMDIDLFNLDATAKAGVDMMTLTPYLGTGFGLADRFFVSPYLGFPIGIAIDSAADSSFSLGWGLPLAARVVSRFYVLTEMGGSFLLTSPQTVSFNFTPAVAYQTDRFSVKFGVPLIIKPDDRIFEIWALSLYLSANF